MLAAWLVLFQFMGNSILGYIHTPSLFSWMHERIGVPAARPMMMPTAISSPSWSSGCFGGSGRSCWRRHSIFGGQGCCCSSRDDAAHIGLCPATAAHLHRGAVHRDLWFDGAGLGARMAAEKFFPVLPFCFFDSFGRSSQVHYGSVAIAGELVDGGGGAYCGHRRDARRVQLIDPSGTYQYAVAAACSGIRSLIAIFLLATIFGFITFRSTWKRLFLMALAFPFAVLGNLARMLFIIVAAEIGGRSGATTFTKAAFSASSRIFRQLSGCSSFGRLMEKWWGTGESVEQGHP